MGQGSDYRFSRTVFFNGVVVKLVSVLVNIGLMLTGSSPVLRTFFRRSMPKALGKLSIASYPLQPI